MSRQPYKPGSVNYGDSFEGEVRKGPGGNIDLQVNWTVIAYDKNGDQKWRDDFANLITNVGRDYALDVALSSGTQIGGWYVALTDGTPTVAGADTMASHAGWAEVQAYTEGVRQVWIDAGVTAGSADNSGNTATFSINANGTVVGGGFLTSDNTKGGTSGTLYAAGAFSAGDKSLDSGDTLDVTATFTSADDGV